jgi:hypothetical protein
MSFPYPDWIRRQDIVECALCGITLPGQLMVPDGGAACADVRWYCQDAAACTRRWTSPQAAIEIRHPVPARSSGGEAAPSGDEPGLAGELERYRPPR